MSDLRKRFGFRLPQITGRGLKIFSAVILLLTNISRVILEKGLIRVDDYSASQLLEAMDESPSLVYLSGAASVMQLLAGLAVPVFALLLVEGFLHTRSFSGYLERITATALISEIAYDFAMSGRFLEFSQQNPMLALTVCLIMMYLMGLLDSMARVEKGIGRFLIALCAVFWVVALRVEYGVEMVLLTTVFYCFRKHSGVKILLGVLVSLMEPLGPMAFIGIGYYNGSRTLKCSKYVYYALYPLQLLILGTVTRCFLL